MALSTKTSFWNTNVGKTLKAAAYVALSAVISYGITETSNNPALFGQVTVLINMVLVLVKTTFFDKSTPNLGSN